MKIYNFTNEIVDREDESDVIKQDLEKSCKNKVHIIYSKTAVGKSALSQKIIEKCSENSRHTILVKTNPENDSSNTSDWLYIDKIFDSLNKYFEENKINNILDFDGFVYKSNDKYMKKLIRENISEQLFLSNSKLDLLKVLIYYSFKKILRIGEFNSFKLLESNSFNSRMFKIRYIQYVLTKIDLFMVIDNIQNIDNSSMKYFLDWLNISKTRNHYFILEYTLSSNHNILDLFQLANQINSTGTLVSYSELKKLSAEFAIDVIEQQFPNKPNDLDFNINLLKQYNADPDGNLRRLIDYTVEYTPKNNSINNPTLNNLNTLSVAAKYIFAAIIFCNGEISKKIIYDICQELSMNLIVIESTIKEIEKNV